MLNRGARGDRDSHIASEVLWFFILSTVKICPFGLIIWLGIQLDRGHSHRVRCTLPFHPSDHEFLLFPIIYPMYGLHMCEDVCKYAQKMFLSLWDGSAASYASPDISCPCSMATEGSQKDLRRISEGPQKDLRRTLGFPTKRACDKKWISFLYIKIFFQQ